MRRLQELISEQSLSSPDSDGLLISSDRLASLRRDVRRLRTALAGVVLVAGVWMVSGFVGAPGVLRVRGIIVVDGAGRERILIGAPTPSVPHRRRKDGNTTSIVVLDSTGADRLIIGEAPNPRIGSRVYPRIAAGYGMLLHDSSGSERGGVTELDNGRGVISLDRANGDAVELVQNDRTGFAGLTVNYARPLGEYAEGIRIGTRDDTAWVAVSDTTSSERARLMAVGGNKPHGH